MKVTGYQIREALKRWTLKKDAASQQFNSSVFQFEDEARDKSFIPANLAQEFQTADRNVATLETLQQSYNLNVKLTVQGESMSLANAVKLVGGAGRMEKMWRDAATSDGQDRYHNRNVRNKDEVRAKKMVSPTEAMTLADKAATRAGSLRAAIAVANSSEVDVTVLTSDKIDASLFS